MTDATVQPPATKLERWTAALGNLARPFAIYVTSLSAAISTVIIAARIATKDISFSEGAIFLGAVYAGVGALYGVRSWENAKTGKHAAEVEVAKATGEAK